MHINLISNLKSLNGFKIFLDNNIIKVKKSFYPCDSIYENL